MIRVVVASILLLAAAPAFAQQAPPAPGQRAVEIMLQRQINQNQQDLGSAIQLQDEVAALTKKVKGLTDELAVAKKAAAAPPADAPKAEMPQAGAS